MTCCGPGPMYGMNAMMRITTSIVVIGFHGDGSRAGEVHGSRAGGPLHLGLMMLDDNYTRCLLATTTEEFRRNFQQSLSPQVEAVVELVVY
ncbi:unnamed protein product [Sphagnum balticum]